MPPVKLKEPIYYSDVDDTIVSWEPDYLYAPGKMEFTDPNDNTPYWLTPMFAQIQRIKDMKKAGYTVVIWSQGGADWCEHVIQQLGLSQYVDAYLAKASLGWYCDDLPVTEWMPESVRIKPK